MVEEGSVQMNRISIKQYLVKGGLWAFAGKVSALLMGLALSSLLARLLSPEDMGAYFLALNLATFFSIFSRIGLDNTLQRFVAEALGRDQPHIACAIIRKGLILTLIGALLVAVAVYLWVGPWVNQYLLTSERLGNSIGFVSVWLILLTFQYVFTAIFQAAQQIRIAVIINGLLTSSIATVFIAYYFLVKGQATLYQVLPWILVAGGFNILIAILTLINKKANSDKSTKKDKSVGYARLAGHSWPLLINTVMVFIQGQSGLWVIGSFRSDAEVAAYGAAIRLVLLTSMTLMVVNTVLPPLIVHLHADNQKKRLEKVLRSTATIASIPSLAVLLCYIFFGGWMLETIFGEYYRTGATVLMITSLAQAVNVLVGSCGYVLIMTGHNYVIMFISIASSIIALSGSLLLVQSYGSTGVAIGYTVAMFVQQLAMLLFARYRCGVWTHASFYDLWYPIKDALFT
ncbi:MAG: flippase [Candidatus Electrothrix sp. GW3-4]|uniref:flippase n=1 Tax=Candidatus Electrothrix sp. GW3-4 TaxID=3126740 RepID=UPI0030CF2243